MRILTTSLIAFLLISLSQCSSPPVEDEESLNRIIERVENSLYGPVMLEGDTLWNIVDRMEHYGVPGLSIAVIKDGEIHWAKSYGVTDKESLEPVTNETLFQAGSISKPVAAYGALRMVEEGKLSLDENVNSVLTTWKLPENEFTEEKHVALKHLLSHTGGVTVHGFRGYHTEEDVPSLVQLLDGDGPANSAPIRVNKVPEESYRYSGGGYCVMQQMLIDIEGESFPEILKSKVLDPLGMVNSTYDQPLDSETIKMAATGYLPNGQMTRGKRHTYPEMAAAGLWTTAEDLAKFAIDLNKTYKGESSVVLSQDMATQMLTPFVEDFIGLGIFLTDKRGTTYFGHGGWDEGFSAELVASKDGDDGVVILTNSNHPPMIRELIRSVARVYDWEGYLHPVYWTLDIEGTDHILGRYRYDSDEVIEITQEGGELYFKYLLGDPMQFFRIGENKFIRREREAAVLFVENPEDDKLYLFFEQNEGDEPEFTIPRLSEDEKVPLEWVLEGNYDKALEAYQALKSEDPDDNAVREGRINNLGYGLLGNGEVQMAIEVFKINVALYPDAYNTYDSLGEAYMEDGQTEKAITNYEKSLELNPDNTNAVEMLKKLRAS